MFTNNIIDMKNINVMNGGTKGNLLKTIIILNNEKYYCKTGRQQSRDYPNNFGIEPVVEVICYRLAEALNISCATQEFGIAEVSVRGMKQLTLITLSKDFNCKACVPVNLSRLLTTGKIIYEDYESIIKFNNCKNYIERIMLFDYIIANEDRHNRNIEWLLSNGIYEEAPIFDNGYSLLYDDIKGMLNRYKIASLFCNCNSFYRYFEYVLNTVGTKERALELCRINIEEIELKAVVESVMEEYLSLIKKYNLNNVSLTAIWFESVYNFINWRLDNVKCL